MARDQMLGWFDEGDYVAIGGVYYQILAKSDGSVACLRFDGAEIRRLKTTIATSIQQWKFDQFAAKRPAPTYKEIVEKAGVEGTFDGSFIGKASGIEFKTVRVDLRR